MECRGQSYEKFSQINILAFHHGPSSSHEIMAALSCEALSSVGIVKWRRERTKLKPGFLHLYIL